MVLIALGTWGASTSVFAEDPLGAYIGAAGGESDVRLDRSLTSTLNDVNEHHSGWKARPTAICSRRTVSVAKSMPCLVLIFSVANVGAKSAYVDLRILDQPIEDLVGNRRIFEIRLPLLDTAAGLHLLGCSS